MPKLKLLLRVNENKVHAVIVQKNEKRETSWDSQDFEKNLKDLLEKNEVRSVALFLDSEDVECEQTIVQKLSWWDRRLLKQQTQKTRAVDGKLLIGPHVMTRVKTSSVESNELCSEKTMLTTVVTLSPLSQRVMNWVKNNQIPVSRIDLFESAIAEKTIQNIGKERFKTDWICMLFPHNQGVRIGVCLRQHLVMFRTLRFTDDVQPEVWRRQLHEEIVHTFYYLNRTGYLSGESITLIGPEALDLLDEASLHQLRSDLNCTILTILTRFEDPEKGISSCYCPELSAHKKAFYIPKILRATASTMAIMATVLMGYQIHDGMIEKEKQTTVVEMDGVSYPLPMTHSKVEELAQLTQQEQAAISIWKDRAAQNWEARHFFQTLQLLFQAAHKGKFLVELSQTSARKDPVLSKKKRSQKTSGRLNFKAVFSPVVFYKDQDKAKISKNFLKSICHETVEEVKKSLGTCFPDSTIQTKTKASGMKMTVEATLLEHPNPVKKKRKIIKKTGFIATKAQTIAYLMDSY